MRGGFIVCAVLESWKILETFVKLYDTMLRRLQQKSQHCFISRSNFLTEKESGQAN